MMVLAPLALFLTPKPSLGEILKSRLHSKLVVSAMRILQQLTRRKLKTVVLENECIARTYFVLGGAPMMVAAGTSCHWF